MEGLSRYIALSLAILWMASSCTALMRHVKMGRCPEVESVKGFRVNDFAGKWFVGYNFGNKFTACTSFMLTMGSEDGYYDVQTTTRVSYEKAMETRATLAPRSTENKALMSWSWNAFPAFVEQVTVINGNFSSYAALFICTNVGFFHINDAIVLTRTKRQLSRENIMEAQGQLEEFFPNQWARGMKVRRCVHTPRSTPAPETFNVDSIVDSVSNSFKAFLEMF